MRRKSERTASKKAKPSPEKKIEKVKRTRSRRSRKQSTSSDNESAEETVTEVLETVSEEDKKLPQTPKKADSPDESQDQVWQVKTAESSGENTGEIQKLKICLTRPPSTPERVDRSPRSKRKHSRATSSSDTPSVEGAEDRKKKHRSKRTTRESKDEDDKKHDSQEEPDTDIEKTTNIDNEITQSGDNASKTEELPMSTTNDDSKSHEDKAEDVERKDSSVEEIKENNQTKSSDADTTVVSPRDESVTVSQTSDSVAEPAQDEIAVVSSKDETNQADVKILTCTSPNKESPKRQRSESIDKSEVLEIHVEEDTKIESDNDTSKKESEVKASDSKVSKLEGKIVNVSNETGTINKTDVVENSHKSGEKVNENDPDQNSSVEKQKEYNHSESTQSNQEESHNGPSAPIVISRKRRWGSRPAKVTSQKSITISTDILKEIIPDVKPVEFEEVIEEKEKKHKRVEVDKVQRPILPKIVIDNTENVEQLRREKDLEDNEKESGKSRESHLAANRKISIVKDSDSIITRPPSPPRQKQSCILFISNLVRPFTLPQLKNLLQRTGRIEENGFWIDRIKSKCFVKYVSEDQAVETRHALHGVTWPVSNPKTLQVDFSTQEAFDKAKLNEESDNAQVSTIPGTVEDWLREQDLKRERGELEKPWERKAAMREWDLGKGDKEREKDKIRRDDERRPLEKRRHRTPERSPEPARKFKKKEDEAPAKLLDDLFRKTKTTPCIYWLPLSAETIAIKEEQRRQHMAEHERRLQELRRTHRRHYGALDLAAVRWSSKMVRSVLLVLSVALAAASAQNPFTLEEFVGGVFAQSGFNGVWISDTEFTYTIPGETGIYIFDVEQLNSTVLVSGELMAQLNTSNPILSADRQYILAPSEVQSVYRYSTTGRYSLYGIQNDTTTLIADHQRLQLCIFGGGHSLAYVLNNNVYYLPENYLQPIQLTYDGVEGVIYNGHTDWVYEEDVMYTGQATWFSTGGTYLAFASFNDTLVESYSYYYYVDKTDPDDPYPELFDLKYPKVGRTNPTVTLRLVNLNSLVQDNNTSFVTMQPPDIVTEDHILGGVRWISDEEIAIHWLNRRQNYTVLQICNVTNMNCEEEHRDQPNGWVPIALPQFSSDGSFYVSTRWSLPQADDRIWQHLYLTVRINGQMESSSITPGASTVNNYVGMNENGPYFFYTRTLPGQQWRSQVQMAGPNDVCISCDIVMPEGGQCTWATATASRGGRFLSITCSSNTEPSATFLVEPLSQTVLYTWNNNTLVRERLQDKIRPISEIFTVPLENGIEAPVRLHFPPGIDLNDNSTTYPMVYYVYSGPNTNTVFDTFTVGYHSYLATSRNVIYMLADGRGSGLNGQEMLYSLNNALGTVEVEDHLVILRQVLDRYPVIDRSRVGIWGHSYGGYATLLTLIKDQDHLFRCGIASALVTSWLYYNTMYTERYMGLPTEEDNLRGYEAGDVTLLAEDLRGHDFFVLHGNADDNVHYQNAAKLYTELQRLNIPFEQMSYPDEAHGLAGVPMHRYNAMNRYWEKCLDIDSEIR
ncbi:uncharacterized protein LOC106142992 [Amyelois transitella]|uniref:uncharacterized protein LOC106142992 n=1 Tax=Amyelois transitella TaxID=680683 RepID=UPI00067D2E68|nr:uncharacterized protein LOC106142992 [Amyelois transitella]